MLVAGGFFEWLGAQSPSTIKLMFLFGGILLVGLTWILADAWRRARQSEHKAQITALMLQRGMSADEVAEILRAGEFDSATTDATDAADTANERSGASSEDPEVRLVKCLTAQHYEGADIQRILTAARVGGSIDERTIGLVKALAENWDKTDDIVRILETRSAHLKQPQEA